MPTGTAELVFVHVPKTGGCWVVSVLRAQGPTEQLGPSHTPLGRLSAEQLGSRQVFAVLREPAAWYESWYLHARATSDHGPRALQGFGSGSLAFRDVLWGATHPAAVAELPLQFAGMLWFQRGFDHRSALSAHGGGLWSWFYDHLLGTPPQASVLLDHTDLFGDLGQLLGCRLDPERYPPQHTRDNRASRVAAETEWDAEMHQWVEEADGPRYASLQDLLLKNASLSQPPRG